MLQHKTPAPQLTVALALNHGVGTMERMKESVLMSSRSYGLEKMCLTLRKEMRRPAPCSPVGDPREDHQSGRQQHCLVDFLFFFFLSFSSAETKRISMFLASLLFFFLSKEYHRVLAFCPPAIFLGSWANNCEVGWIHFLSFGPPEEVLISLPFLMFYLVGPISS